MHPPIALPLWLALLTLLVLPAAPACAADGTNASRPLFFTELIALDTDKHRSLTLPAERKSYAFAARANLLPVTVAEAGLALRHYPLVFLPEGEQLGLVALAGLPGAANPYIDAQGQWRPGTYIPAYVRGYPFIALRPSANADPVLAFDPAADDFKAEGGLPLLEKSGQPSDRLKAILAYQSEFRLLSEATLTMSRALNDAGVLEAGSLQLQPADRGEAQKIGGFLVVSEQKLRALPAEALKKLVEADALGLAYAQLFSMASLPNLLAIPGGSSASPTSPPESASPRPTAARSKKKPE